MADRRFILTSFQVNHSGRNLQYAHPDLQMDQEVVLAGLKHDPATGEALKFASDDLRQSRAFVLGAVGWSGISLRYAVPELRSDAEVVRTALVQNAEALRYASQEL